MNKYKITFLVELFNGQDKKDRETFIDSVFNADKISETIHGMIRKRFPGTKQTK